MKIVCISDTHNCRPPVPPGDILIHAGDLTMDGSPHQLESAIAWLKKQPHTHKIIIAGNHDRCLQSHTWTKHLFNDNNMHYLQDSMAELEGLRIWGSPWTLQFFDWAFMKTESQLEDLYAAIPPCDILITHGPPFGILDQVPRGDGTFRPNCGSKATLALSQRLKPKLHIFGHIHEGHGVVDQDGIKYINASYCNHDLTGPLAANDPIEIDLEASDI